MTQEEKAKRFDEIFVKARKYYDEYKTRDNILYVEDMEDMFPEFKEKESEDDRIRKDCLKYLDWEYHRCSHDDDKIKIEKCIDWLKKQGEKKSTEWSEEDEKMIHGLIAICDVWTTSHSFYPIENRDMEKLKSWLKCLKDRVQSQNTITVGELSQAKKEAYYDALDKIEYHSDEEPTFDDGWSAAIWYLKKRNAQLQFTWEPSDEQMHAFKQVYDWYNNNFAASETLTSLYQDLKKLREE